MGRSVIFTLKWMLACLLVAGASVGNARADDAPVRAEYLETNYGKPTLRSYLVRLTLVNAQDTPAWVVLPYNGEDKLPENGIFANKMAQPFGGKQFVGEGGSVVEVQMHGGKGFKAFHLPAKARLELDGYGISAWQDVNQMDVLEARGFLVNGKTPLEKWLPYPTLCAAKAKISRQAQIEWGNLDWDREKLRKRDDYPKEQITEIKAEGVRRWTIPLEGKKPEPRRR
jgi:hypothetical protein